MFFKSLFVFTFCEPFALNTEQLSALLERRRFAPCESQQAMSLGWDSPTGERGGALVRTVSGCHMLCLRSEDKLLPASVVNEIMAERIEAIEDERGQPMGRKERQQFKEDITRELLARAFSRSRRDHAYIDPRHGWLIVDSASGARIDAVTSLLRQCLGSLPITPLTTLNRGAAMLTDWLREPPEGITLGTTCTLREPDRDGGELVVRRIDLDSEEITQHLETGKKVTKLGACWQDRIYFVIDEFLVVRRFRFLDVVHAEADGIEAETPLERFDADFALLSGEIAAFMPRLVDLFKAA